MPSIEIICVGQADPLCFSDLPFAVEAERELISHRSSPLFQAEFDKLQGCIYHLGNPVLRNPEALGCYTAYDLLSKEKGTEWWEIVHFAPEFVSSVKQFLEQLIASSPEDRVLFTSDYQFGPLMKRYEEPFTPDHFWQLHDEKKLRMNALYKLKP